MVAETLWSSLSVTPMRQAHSEDKGAVGNKLSRLDYAQMNALFSGFDSQGFPFARPEAMGAAMKRERNGN